MQKALLGILVAAAVFLAPVRRSFDSWKSYGGGVDSSQYSSLRQINKTSGASSGGVDFSDRRQLVHEPSGRR